MRSEVLTICAALILALVGTSSFAEDTCAEDTRVAVNQLCAQGDTAGAVHLAMKSWKKAESAYGKEHPCTAEFIVTLADVAKFREKYHLAELLYAKALATLEKRLGAADPHIDRIRISLNDVHLRNGLESSNSSVSKP